MGYQDSVNGTAVTEAFLDENSKQVVMKYATAAARNADAALSAACREGMVSYQDDINSLIVQRDATLANISTVGPVHGALTNWTPVVVQGVTPTLAVGYATYSRVGRRVTAQATVQLSSAGTAANVITMTLPVNCAFVSDYFTIGTGIYGDVSDAALGWKRLFVISASASTVKFGDVQANGPISPTFFGVNPGITIANGDVLSINVTYEAAADG